MPKEGRRMNGGESCPGCKDKKSRTRQTQLAQLSLAGHPDSITAWVRGARPGYIDSEKMFRRVMATGGRKGRRLGSQIRVNSRCYLIPAQPPMKQARPEHFVMKRQGAHRAGTGLMACAAIAFPGSGRRCASVLPEQVFMAPGVPPALFPDLPGERSGSSHRSRKWGAATTLPPFLQSGSGLLAAGGAGAWGRRHHERPDRAPPPCSAGMWLELPRGSRERSQCQVG